MRRFQFRLQSVLEVRKTARDECRARLAASFAATHEFEARRQAIEHELGDLLQSRQACQIGALDVQRLATTQRYESVLRGDARYVDEQIVALEEQIEQERQALVAADRQMRILERLREKHLDQHRRTDAATDARELDDVVRSTAREEPRS